MYITLLVIKYMDDVLSDTTPSIRYTIQQTSVEFNAAFN